MRFFSSSEKNPQPGIAGLCLLSSIFFHGCYREGEKARPDSGLVASSPAPSAGEQALRARLRSLAEAFREQANVPGERTLQVDLGSCGGITASQSVQRAAQDVLQCVREVGGSERDACTVALQEVLSGYCNTVDVLFERHKNTFNPFTKKTLAEGACDVEALGLIMKCAFLQLTGGQHAALEERLSALQQIIGAHKSEISNESRNLKKD